MYAYIHYNIMEAILIKKNCFELEYEKENLNIFVKQPVHFIKQTRILVIHLDNLLLTQSQGMLCLARLVTLGLRRETGLSAGTRHNTL